MNARLFSQSDLLAEIMHELKTPLMAIRSASELMSRPNFPQEKHVELVNMIRREAIRLSNMTKDFLDFARLESGRVRLKNEVVDLMISFWMWCVLPNHRLRRERITIYRTAAG
ncbi:MAG: histidine kinase dimerization/phospho-acceptor domain-containing protein [Chloroflexota bacterium]